MPHAGSPAMKPTILHLGEPIIHHLELYDRLNRDFDFIRPEPPNLARSSFIENLRRRTWGDFSAIMRPFWNTGGEMGRWDREIIDLLPETVKVYASAGAGYDWVDTDALADRGILYCNARGASTEAVADMGLYYIISVFRNMPLSHMSARCLNSELFNKAHFELPLTSHNPRGHSLGVIGLGDIGFAIAKKVYAAFGMKILYNDLDRKPAWQEEEVEAIFYPNLETMLGVSDCVLIATPFSGKTLITADILAKFKKGSRLVNIARGSLIDETALAEALESGHISGAGLDVHANEPHVNPRLANNWQVGITSHTGGGALETWIQFEKLALENVERVLTGREALTGVNQDRLKRRDNASDQAPGNFVNGDSMPMTEDENEPSTTSIDRATEVNRQLHHDELNGNHHDDVNGDHHDDLNGNGHVALRNELDGSMHRQAGILGGV